MMEKFKKWLLLCLGVKNKPEEIFWGVDSFLYLDRVLGYTGICIYENLSDETLKFLHFIIFKF